MTASLLRRLAVITGCAAISAAALPAAAQAKPPARPPAPVVVVSGLNNPRQLSLVDGVELLIAEAGRGGDIPGPPDPEGGELFLGTTGSVSSVWLPHLAHDQRPHRVLTGLPSGAGPDGSFAIGSAGVSALRPHGPILVQEAFASGVLPPEVDENGLTGQLLRGNPNRPLSPVADIAGYEIKHDPDGQGVDSNAYAVLALRDGGALVADAGANDVLRVDARGRVSVFHVFANITDGLCAGQFDPTEDFPGCNFVPTSLATDRHGNVYVGGLGSMTPGAGQVVKLDPTGRKVLERWTGFTAVHGVAVGQDGSVYASELFAAGQDPESGIAGKLVRIAPNGKRTELDVPFPAGVAADNRGNVYVAVYSIATEDGLGFPGTSGQIWRVRFP